MGNIVAEKTATKNIFSTSGFSLLEVIIALAVLSIGLVGTLTLINASIGINEEAHNRFVASMLLDQAFTHIQNIRDTNTLNALPWDEQIENCDDEGDTCILGYSQSCFSCGANPFSCEGDPPKLIPVSGETPLYYNRAGIDALTYFQAQSVPGCFDDDETIFERSIHFERIDTNHVKPTVLVTWTSDETHTVMLTTDLYNIE